MIKIRNKGGSTHDKGQHYGVFVLCQCRDKCFMVPLWDVPATLCGSSVITHTMQVTEILGDLPVESWDLNPGQLTVAPTH